MSLLVRLRCKVMMQHEASECGSAVPSPAEVRSATLPSGRERARSQGSRQMRQGETRLERQRIISTRLNHASGFRL